MNPTALRFPFLPREANENKGFAFSRSPHIENTDRAGVAPKPLFLPPIPFGFCHTLFFLPSEDLVIKGTLI